MSKRTKISFITYIIFIVFILIINLAFFTVSVYPGKNSPNVINTGAVNNTSGTETSENFTINNSTATSKNSSAFSSDTKNNNSAGASGSPYFSNTNDPTSQKVSPGVTTKINTPTPTPSASPFNSVSPVKPSVTPDGKTDPSRPMVALTFDDGPSANATGRILNVLQKYNAKATFFIVGSRLDSGSLKNLLKTADSLGCEIGNHTYSHKDLTKLNAAGIQSEISKTDVTVESIISKTPQLVRPTYGKYNPAVLSAVNFPLICWSIDTEDWLTRNADKTINNIKSNVKNGDIILMHDLYSSTADACETIIPYLIDKGYQLVTVSELFYYRGIDLKAGNVYRNARK